jgi:hypothetical protein
LPGSAEDNCVDYPDKERELEIVLRKMPGAAEALSLEIIVFIARLRGRDLYKLPGSAVGGRSARGGGGIVMVEPRPLGLAAGRR